MDEETKIIISNQTGEKDLVNIEKVYYECNGDIGETICKLQNIKYQPKPKRPYNKMDEMREILDEKDEIFAKKCKVYKENNVQ